MSAAETTAAPVAAVMEPVCGARTRRGGWCRQRPLAGKRRCRMHGGAPGSGAPFGNRNARKHGGYTREVKELSAAAEAMRRRLARTIALIKQAGKGG